MMHKLVPGLLLAVTACLVHAEPVRSPAPDPLLEQRVMAIAAELRCLVCQNQTIADSDAALAVDLRQHVREKLAQGLSDRDVRNFMVERYGDFVLYRPPVKTSTWLLWLGPFLFLAGGLIGLGLQLRRRAHAAPAAALSDTERRRVAGLLGTGADAKETM
ncbi:MAG TPA: cytochrome c-type biogenesis protein [Telluria sp.]|jgi:cytochrome c-type biogenesis protein CcmH